MFRSWLCGFMACLPPFLSAQPCGVGASSSALREEARRRLRALRTYVPQEFYRWHCMWVYENRRWAGTLTGKVEGQHHGVEIAFASGETLFFDKWHPNWILYPNRLCLYPEHRWGDPFPFHPALNGVLLTMPFLSWPIVRVAKTAKLGRKAIRVDVQRGSQRARLFCDQNFNTLLKVEWEDTQRHQRGSFTLNSFKKFPQGWGLGQAVYELNGKQTTLHVLSCEVLDQNRDNFRK